MSEDDWIVEDTRLARFVVAIFGKARLVRFMEWAQPTPDPCPYHAPLSGEQCLERRGHRGSCHTRTIYGDDRYWYGINYDHETGAYIWTKPVR